jgi:hypothetical protein
MNVRLLFEGAPRIVLLLLFFLSNDHFKMYSFKKIITYLKIKYQ